MDANGHLTRLDDNAFSDLAEEGRTVLEADLQCITTRHTALVEKHLTIRAGIMPLSLELERFRLN